MAVKRWFEESDEERIENYYYQKTGEFKKLPYREQEYRRILKQNKIDYLEVG